MFMETVLSIKNLDKNYGSFQAIKGLNLSIEKGHCVGLLGSNGAGKSTTIRIITGQLSPSSGLVEVFGIDPTRYPKKVHPFIGYIPDTQTLYEDLTVQDNILVFAELYGQSQKEVDGILEKVRLVDKKKTKVKKLSKGLKQRVLIARALLHNPEFIILDEPTTGLDPSSAENIYAILESLKKEGATLLLSTHLMNDVERLCDKIVFIDKGVKVEEGSPQELKNKYSLPQMEALIETSEGLKQVGFPKDENWMDKLQELSQQGPVISLNTHQPKLEDIFIEVVGRGKSDE
jgi:ABC-2 type transport system ATP-binding protein